MDKENFVPFECPVCLTLMRDAKDVFTFLSSKCCYECKAEYLIPHRIKDSRELYEDEEVKNSLRNKRKQLPSYILR